MESMKKVLTIFSIWKNGMQKKILQILAHSKRSQQTNRNQNCAATMSSFPKSYLILMSMQGNALLGPVEARVGWRIGNPVAVEETHGVLLVIEIYKDL